MASNNNSESEDTHLTWILERPKQPVSLPVLAVLCGDWSYGLIPYCGPGGRKALWENEMAFLNALSSHLIGQGIFTLRLSCDEEGLIPEDQSIAERAGHDGLLLALNDLDDTILWSPGSMIFIGHGLGGYVCCQLASYGIRPAGFIFAGCVYSDLEVILSQKYLLPLESQNRQNADDQVNTSDAVSLLIAKNMGTILQAMRKNRSRIQLQDMYRTLEFRLNPILYTGNETPKHMFRYITSPTLIIHGASDLDVSVWNATSIEQAIRKTVQAPERIIMEDLDHWFRTIPGSASRHMQDRVSGACFYYEQDEKFFRECTSFIRRVSGIHDPEAASVKRYSQINREQNRKKTSEEHG